ncbi:MAG: response regulator, partial [Deltaproteobacteria bacterium]|nr:response regulator [Deltaproteobacteria bacterium]
MAVITIFSGAFCRGDQVAELLSQSHGLELVPDEAVTLEASKRFQISQDKFHCALSGETSVFNRFTHEKERCLAHVKGVLSG